MWVPSLPCTRCTWSALGKEKWKLQHLNFMIEKLCFPNTVGVPFPNMTSVSNIAEPRVRALSFFMGKCIPWCGFPLPSLPIGFYCDTCRIQTQSPCYLVHIIDNYDMSLSFIMFVIPKVECMALGSIADAALSFSHCVAKQWWRLIPHCILLSIWSPCIISVFLDSDHRSRYC